MLLARGFGLVFAQHLAHPVALHFADLFVEQPQLQSSRAQQPADLRNGERRDIVRPRRRERLLPLALHHTPIADED